MARYVGAINDQASPAISLPDFTVRKKDGTWHLKWNWKTQPKLEDIPRNVPYYKKKNLEKKHLDGAYRELQTWYNNGWLEYIGEISDHPNRRWLPLSIVVQEHKSTPVRVTVDLKYINEHVDYREEASKHERCDVKMSEWRRIGQGYLIDLKKAFLKIKLEDATQRKYLTICVSQSLYEFRVMPFGLNISPRVLYEVMTAVLRGRFPTVSFYRDDIFIPDKELVTEVVRELNANGFETKPAAEIGFNNKQKEKVLGLTLETENGKLIWRREPKEPGDWNFEVTTYSEAEALLARLLPSGHVPIAGWLRPVVARLRSEITRAANKKLGRNGKADWAAPIEEQEILSLLQHVENRLKTENPMKGIWQMPSLDSPVVLFTDAGNDFLGYVIANEQKEPVLDYCVQLAVQKNQANYNELEAVRRGLNKCLKLGYTNIHLMIDSKTVIAWVNKAVKDEKIRIKGLYELLIERRLWIIQQTIREYNANVISINYVESTNNPADELTKILGYRRQEERSIGSIQKLIAYPKTKQAVETTPEIEASKVVKMLHEELIHPSINTMQRICTELNIFNKETKQQILAVSNNCEMCAKKRARQTATSTRTCLNEGMDEIFIDTVKMANKETSNPYCGFITVIHGSTRLVQVSLLQKPVDGAAAVAALQQWAATYHVPEVIRTDNGVEFINSKMRNWCEQNGVRQIRTSIANPQSNGIVERVHRTLLNYIRAQSGSNLEWHNRLLNGVRIYNKSKHSALSDSPLETWIQFIQGSNGQTPDSANSEVESGIESDSEIERLDHSLYQVGDKVLWHDPQMVFQKDKFGWLEGHVQKVKGLGAYVVEFRNGKTRVVNERRMSKAGNTQENEDTPENDSRPENNNTSTCISGIDDSTPEIFQNENFHDTGISDLESSTGYHSAIQSPERRTIGNEATQLDQETSSDEDAEALRRSTRTRKKTNRLIEEPEMVEKPKKTYKAKKSSR